MLRGLVVVAAVVAQVRDAPSGYRAGKPSGANAFALYDACNSSLRALVAAGAKARSLDAIVACETVACACDGSGAPPDCPMAQPWVAADWNDLLEPTARDEAKIHGEEPAGRAPDAALYRLATQLLKRQLVVAMECGAALGLSSHLDFENATRGVNRYIGTIMRVEALANLLPHLFEAQRYRFACCLASEERLGGCGDAAPSGEDPAAAAALRAGKLDRTLRAALEGAPALDGGGSVDVSPKATSRYAVARIADLRGPLKRLTFAYRSEQDKAKGRRYANHVIDRVFRRVLPRLEPLPDGRAALDDLVFFGLSVLTSSPYPFLHYDQDWTLFPDAAGFQVWVLVDASELPNAGNLFVAETPELLESDPPLRWDFDERGGATKNTYLGTQFPMPLKTYGSWERGAKLSLRYFNGTEGARLLKRTLHMSDPRPHLLRDLRSGRRTASPSPPVVDEACASYATMYSSRSAEDAGEKTTSSRAVLAALRALQDKIARLEGERAEAVNSTKEMRHQLREMELKVESHRLDGAEESRLRSAYERLASEAASGRGHARGKPLAAERLLECETRETTLRARRVEEELDEAQRNGATPHVTPEERARYEDELAGEREPPSGGGEGGQARRSSARRSASSRRSSP
ncbi:hypothetical protein JL720_11987 [Aureococcus anophagefferens]|nr:hypothetical protein JL720_11987 [Aureococcus anophagefferens]